LRFAVHRPGTPEASPRSHGVPRRDVPGRVHISVAGVSAGSACEASRPALRHDGRLAGLPGVEERGHRMGNVPQRLLLHHLGSCGQPRVLCAGGGELPALFQVAGRAVAARVPVLVLLYGQVPHVPGVGAVVLQHRFLSGRGEQPVPGHTNTLAITADISWEVKRRFLPGLTARVSTPPS
jgi:hypothetical protein